MTLVVTLSGSICRISLRETGETVRVKGRGVLLNALARLLAVARLDKSDISRMIAVMGPASFTQSRQVAVCLNALSFSLNRPIAFFREGCLPFKESVPKKLRRAYLSPKVLKSSACPPRLTLPTQLYEASFI